MHRVEITRRARRQLHRLSPAGQKRVVECIDAMALTSRPAESRELEAGRGIWRLRWGRYRVLYQLLGDRLLVLGVVSANRQRITKLLQELAATGG